MVVEHETDVSLGNPDQVEILLILLRESGFPIVIDQKVDKENWIVALEEFSEQVKSRRLDSALLGLCVVVMEHGKKRLREIKKDASWGRKAKENTSKEGMKMEKPSDSKKEKWTIKEGETIPTPPNGEATDGE